MKRGYTLAEVLVTIGVIGIVASMTLPILIKKYQYKQWTEQLKKSYSTLDKGFRKMLADDEVFELADTEVFKSITKDDCAHFDNTQGQCKDFYNNMKKYFKIVDIKNIDYKYTYLNDDWEYSYDGYAIFLADGTMIFGYSFIRNLFLGIHGNFYIDMNGLKKPNKAGRDIFYFIIGSDGVYPMGSSMASRIKGEGDASWLNTTQTYKMCELGYKTISGLSCTARVLETGNMDYTVKINPNGSGGSGS
ncbi:type II secretion system protein [bacterium]|nr:type II secretion system protein [bacterium]